MSIGPCPYCRTGNVNIELVDTEYSHNGWGTILKLKNYKCDCCEAEIKDSKGQLIEYNTSVIMAYVREVNRHQNNVFDISKWRNNA